MDSLPMVTLAEDTPSKAKKWAGSLTAGPFAWLMEVAALT